MDDEQKKQIEFRKALSEYKRTSKITECFYHDHSQCKGPIKQAHSIQRNGRLSIIEENVNGNMSVYTFTEFVPGENRMHKTLKPIGKGSASTFFGFCDHHDTELFKEIENSPFDDSDKHRFLHSYRSFAHSYHLKKEELKGYTSHSTFVDLIPEDLTKEMIKGIQISVNESKVRKKILDDLLDKCKYDGLEYFTYILPETFPIACSTCINPPFYPNGNRMNNELDLETPLSDIILTVLPDHNQTIIILACFNDDKPAIKFLDLLSVMPYYKLEITISALMINYAENTFISPYIWEKLGPKGQKALCSELDIAIESESKNFPKTQINFFTPSFAKK